MDSNSETVCLVASGYEWMCPECGRMQHEDAVNMDIPDLTCQDCGANFKRGWPEHVFK